MNDKGFMKYIGACAVYFFLTVAYCFYADQADIWGQWWFSDKFFVFQYVTVLLLGSALIKGKFNALTYCRYGIRTKFIFYQLLQHVILSFMLVSFLFFYAMILTIILGRATDFEIIRIMMNQYCRFLAGSYLVGCLDMILEYSGVKFLKAGSQICVYLMLITELLVFVPKINELIGANIHMLFSWIFFDHIIGYVFLIGWGVILTITLFWVGKRGDLPT
ncbi:MAG: hypothetical protein K2O34_00415 [Acetatifactor sp.]|nr:hypothetical protein [Acetatifactor sp.]